MVALVLLQITALVFMNAGIAMLFELMNTKSKRKKFLLMAAGCFAISTVIYYVTMPELPIWQAPK